jgi:RHS repeat-associated protein
MNILTAFKGGAAQIYSMLVDYRYTIRGWLESINNAKLDNTGGNDDLNDYFGMELQYDNVVSGLSNTAYYNGNISAIEWKGPGTSGAHGRRGYKFTYDKSNRLTNAAFRRYASDWDKEVDALNEAPTYDQNGNILTLQRKGILRGLDANLVTTATAQTIDNLTYSYNADSPNQLLKVADAALGQGFNDTVNEDVEYTYNTDGSILSDDNKDAVMTYNGIGKVSTVVVDAKTITYTYDASGSKLKMVTTDGANTATVDYVNGFVYENNALAYFAGPEGRVVKNGANFERQYALTDHQGNTRVLFSAATPPSDSYFADMEASTSENFENYTDRIAFELMDHTDDDPGPAGYSQKLTGGHNSMVGVARSFKVYPGDKVKIEAYAKYYNPSGTGSSIASFASYLTAAFGVSSGSVGDALKVYNTLNSYGGVIASGGGHEDDGPKRAYVNILMFDKNYTFVDMAYQQIDGGQQPATEVKAPHDYMSAEYTVREEGYAFMFVSNEHPTLVEIYFDDVTMTHTKSNIIQYDEYYPFGAQNGNSWLRENAKGNNYLYNAGSELNAVTSTYETFFRGYDPLLGRMTSIDPMTDKFGSLSGYNYSFNDPVYWNDPSGATPGKMSWEDFWENALEFLSDAGGGNGEDGGMWWRSDGSYGTYSSDQAFNAGANYADHFNMWGAYEGMAGSREEASSDYRRGVASGSSSSGGNGYSSGTNFNKYSYRWTTGRDGKKRPKYLGPGKGFTQGSLSHIDLIHYTIDQVLAMYGYDSRQAYLFPTPSAASRVLPFLFVMDNADLAERFTDAATSEWNRRIGDLQEVDIGNLNRYLGDLFTLKAKLLVSIEALQSEIANLRGSKAAGDVINERSFKMWDYGYQLNPVSIEIDKVTFSLDHRLMK